MKIGKSVRMFIRERLAQRLRRGPLPEVLAAQTRAGLGPIAPFRADLPAFGGLFIRYDYRLGCATPSSGTWGITSRVTRWSRPSVTSPRIATGG